MFKYAPEDADCRNCIEFSKKRGCSCAHCPYVAERIEAGVVGYGEAVAETFRGVPALRLRLAYMISTFPGTLWRDAEHKRRMDSIRIYTGYNRKQKINAYFAALYLLTADRDLYRRAMNAYTRKGVAFNRIKRRGITEQGYTLLGAAKTLYFGSKDVTLADLADDEIIDTDCFRLIVNALLIAKYGVDVLQIRNIRSKFRTGHACPTNNMAATPMTTALGHMLGTGV